jgi:hypothetical protein
LLAAAVLGIAAAPQLTTSAAAPLSLVPANGAQYQAGHTVKPAADCAAVDAEVLLGDPPGQCCHPPLNLFIQFANARSMTGSTSILQLCP